MKTATLDKIILSMPTLLDVPPKAKYSAPRSWIQLAKTGSFVSSRYGKFSITRDDLKQMLHNFRTVTPESPTELPIDYDHLSMEAAKPGDGIAAGWLKDLELRADGDELWGKVEWTPKAAEQIKGGEYRFISPSFVKDHTHKDGRKIGTTLLAAAVTNHPFLEGMSAIVLGSESFRAAIRCDLATPAAMRPTVCHLAETGQRVAFTRDAEQTPELTDEERAATFVVTSVRGLGDDAFVKLESLAGEAYGWYPVTALGPAPASDQQQKTVTEPRLKEPQEIQYMSTNEKTVKAAAKFDKLVRALAADGRSMRNAISLAATQDAAGAEAYRLVGIGTDTDITPAPAPVLSLSAQPGESFDALAERYAAAKRIPLADAVRAVSIARPDLAAAR